ncbi:hypothetical protein X961_1515 [Burkholderia pseudomallei MSHR5613]|nr:hypothetical protein X961_1515 [Burkholderia pseudomallei MSHR5613]
MCCAARAGAPVHSSEAARAGGPADARCANDMRPARALEYRSGRRARRHRCRGAPMPARRGESPRAALGDERIARTVARGAGTVCRRIDFDRFGGHANAVSAAVRGRNGSIRPGNSMNGAQRMIRAYAAPESARRVDRGVGLSLEPITPRSERVDAHRQWSEQRCPPDVETWVAWVAWVAWVDGRTGGRADGRRVASRVSARHADDSTSGIAARRRARRRRERRCASRRPLFRPTRLTPAGAIRPTAPLRCSAAAGRFQIRTMRGRANRDGRSGGFSGRPPTRDAVRAYEARFALALACADSAGVRRRFHRVCRRIPYRAPGPFSVARRLV